MIYLFSYSFTFGFFQRHIFSLVIIMFMTRHLYSQNSEWRVTNRNWVCFSFNVHCSVPIPLFTTLSLQCLIVQLWKCGKWNVIRLHWTCSKATIHAVLKTRQYHVLVCPNIKENISVTCEANHQPNGLNKCWFLFASANSIFFVSRAVGSSTTFGPWKALAIGWFVVQSEMISGH